jgi:peptidoglycan/xylan/chitin deacetylase (PgdA/CDA1 family)
MPRNTPVIWRRPPADLDARIDVCVQSGCEKAETKGHIFSFFRADDVAVPGMQFTRMMDLFAKYGAPLSLAIVPSWLTRDRWQYLSDYERNNPVRCCWHQHGWRHVNHESKGKKQEFGAVRSLSEIKRDLKRGKNRLSELLGESFYPAFTPPWNRCSGHTLQLLRELGFLAVSRSQGSTPHSPRGLPDLYVNVDLHTRKERSPTAGWNKLLQELEQAIATRFCGIMIHHQLMNQAAFDFLEKLLKALINYPKIQLVNFKDLVELGV